MGQTAAEIELDIERQRHALSGRTARLRRRVHEDVETTRSRARDHVSGVKNSVTSSVSDAGHAVGRVAGTTAGSGTAIAEHPKALVAGAAVGGVALGLATGRGEGTAPEPRRQPSKAEAGTGERRGLGKLAELGRSFVVAQAASAVESAVSSAKDGLRSAVSNDTSSDGRGATAEHPVRTDRTPQLREGEPEPKEQPRPPSKAAPLDAFTA